LRRIAAIPAESLADRTLILAGFIPDVGKYHTYLLAAACYRATVVLNHVLRNTEPMHSLGAA
jgi:hypothetical protein